ncbi:hypothetical protein M3649_18815 [Ureibacillus chungkukjangi]|uniref:hypothetical protein n=1 Tax=Ureibacillus chungkukjangi TaxID=1202712 RepID=UPI002040A53D|nr:hypothetical protein [Ureibacillus chungkukjangi]MCM3390151.1 hypothetical protein [Ureibacillus chungkukjangi]
MNKIFLLSLLLFAIFIFGINKEATHANTSDSPQPFEEAFPEIGYKTVEAALKDFEQHYKQELKLPLRVPPISFTHQFGRFSNLYGEMNVRFEVTMISDQAPQNHYTIDIRPVQHKIPFDKYTSQVFKLKSGNDALFINNPKFGFNMLVFEREQWQYILSIDEDVSDKVTADMLVQIANSIGYVTKSGN